MSLTRKLVVTLLAGFLAVLVTSAWLGVQREAALFDSDMRRDHKLLGRALAFELADVLADDGEAVARKRAAAWLGPRDSVRVRWLSLAPDGDATPVLTATDREQLRAGLVVSKRITSRPGLPDTLFTYVPLRGGSRHALEISESLVDEHQYLRHTMRNAALTTLVLLLVTALLAALVGRHFVSRPISAILDKIHRVAAGDLTGHIRLRQRDELGAIASALNEMSAAIAQANERIEAETSARIAAVEQLRHADRLMTVGKLASGVAHELGTPLSVVSGRAEMLLLGDAGPNAKEIARIIRDQTHRMTIIIRQLLDFARKRVPQKKSTDVRGIAERTASLLAPLAEKRRVSLSVTEASDETEASVDEGQIQQVVTNLVANALQATESGGSVRISVEPSTALPPAGVNATGPVPTVRIAVADTGQGMSTEVAARIFEPFFTTKEIGDGTGLGLSVAYGIVREHGGWIDVESEPGRGSTFSVYLPRSENPTP